MKTTFLFLAMMISSLSFSQEIYSGKTDKLLDLIIPTRIELTSMDEKAYLSFGPKFVINEKNYIGLRGHFNWWDADGRKFILIPELDYIYRMYKFEENRDIISSLQTGIGITPNAFSPKVSATFYNFLTLEFGNNFEFKEYENFTTKGFRFSFGINIIY